MKIDFNDRVIEFGKTFVSGKDVIKIDDQLVHEDKFKDGTVVDANIDGIDYQITVRLLSYWTEARMFHLCARQDGETLAEKRVDKNGEEVTGSIDATKSSRRHLFPVLGAGLGGAVVAFGHPLTGGAIPLGPISLGIGGAVGGGIGSLLAELLPTAAETDEQ